MFCLIGGIAFGTFTVALIKLIAPVTIDMIGSVSLPALHIMTCVIAFVMIADTVKTVKLYGFVKTLVCGKTSRIYGRAA